MHTALIPFSSIINFISVSLNTVPPIRMACMAKNIQHWYFNEVTESYYLYFPKKNKDNM